MKSMIDENRYINQFLKFIYLLITIDQIDSKSISDICVSFINF